MIIAFAPPLTLLKGEILVISVLTPFEWRHQLELMKALEKSEDLDDLRNILYGLHRMGLVLRRPHVILFEYMLSDSGLALQRQIIQHHFGYKITQIETPAPEASV